MKKKKRESKIIIHLSNRWLYFFITLGILAIVSVGVYAAQQASSGGGTHDYAEVGIPVCSNGEILKWVELPEWMGGSSWECADDDSGSSLWSVYGSNVYRSSGNVGIGTSNPQSKLDIADAGSTAGTPLLMIGDDTFLTDIDVSNTLGIYGNQDKGRANIQLGSNGGTIYGYLGNIGIGTVPSHKLEVAGDISGAAFDIVSDSFVTIGSYCNSGYWGSIRKCRSNNNAIRTICTCYYGSGSWSWQGIKI